jgi:hypothetical protein
MFEYPAICKLLFTYSGIQRKGNITVAHSKVKSRLYMLACGLLLPLGPSAQN